MLTSTVFFLGKVSHVLSQCSLCLISGLCHLKLDLLHREQTLCPAFVPSKGDCKSVMVAQITGNGQVRGR